MITVAKLLHPLQKSAGSVEMWLPKVSSVRLLHPLQKPGGSV
eukprot:COSAG02_NODE_37221_length_444_cov_3.562319_2_plen_41_part_01